MRTQTEENRRRIVDAAYESFWRLGFRRSSVESIATRAGLTKRTLYGYFRSKDDLLAAVLQRYEELAAERLKHIGDRLPADRIGLLDSFFGQLNEWASSTPRWSGSGFTRLVVELADLPGHPARVIARRAKRKTEAWLAERLEQARVGDASARAREIMLLMEGSMAMTLIHGGREYIDAAARVAKQLVTHSARDELEPAEADARNPTHRGGRAKSTQSDARRRPRRPRVQATPAR